MINKVFSAAEISSRLIFPFVSFVLLVAIFIVYHAKPESMGMSCYPECHGTAFGGSSISAMPPCRAWPGISFDCPAPAPTIRSTTKSSCTTKICSEFRISAAKPVREISMDISLQNRTEFLTFRPSHLSAPGRIRTCDPRKVGCSISLLNHHIKKRHICSSANIPSYFSTFDF